MFIRLISDLHQRVLRGDTAAVEELASLLLPRIERRLRGRFSQTDPALVNDAAEDAVLEYLRQPGRFDGEFGVSIEQFNALAAKRNVLDLIRRENRRPDREPLPAEACLHVMPPAFINPSSPAVLLEVSEDRAAEDQMQAIRQHWLEEFARALPAPDQEFFKLRILGERRWARYARVLGIAQKPLPEQRKLVHLAKTRVYRRLGWWMRKRRKASGAP